MSIMWPFSYCLSFDSGTEANLLLKFQTGNTREPVCKGPVS